MTIFDDLTLDAGFCFTGLGPEAFGLPLRAEDYFAPVACRIGYGPENLPCGEKADKIVKILSQGISAVAMAGLGKPAAIADCGGGQFSAGPVRVESARWAHVVRQAVDPRHLYCFILTLGHVFDRLKTETGLFEAYVLDGLGSEIVERAADRVEETLRAWCVARNLECSRRFSPGYCDWPLAQGQQALSAFLEPAAVGVKILASGAMVPSKSISAAVVAAQGIPLPYPCSICKQIDCPYRRA